MKAATLTAARPARLTYLELTKPRLTFFVLIVVAIGGWMTASGWGDFSAVFHAVAGTALVAGGASAFNMLVERRHDARMRRTWNRPLPSGRLRTRDVALFGAGTTALGLFLLAAFATPLAMLLAAATSAIYLGLYTPLKRVTTLNTHIGAIPGALPALIGFAAVRGDLADPRAWTLFAVVYLWQIPHFLSIAWLYRDEYGAAGFRMLPSIDADGVATGRQAVLGALALVPVTLVPTLTLAGGPWYVLAALLLGGWFVRHAVGFAIARNEVSARRLLRASLVYLPLLLALQLLACG